MFNPAVIAAYLLGDRLGAPWETGDVLLTNRSLEVIQARGSEYPNGTDESDIVRCFLSFVQNYRYEGREKLLLDWCVYHQRHHRASGYGRTYRDHFGLVKQLIKERQLNLDTIFRISAERNSFGNGCLALVYPVACYAASIGENPTELAQDFTRLTHAQPRAVNAVNDLLRIILNPKETLLVAREIGIEGISREELIKVYPSNVPADWTLAYALYAALHGNREDVILTAVNMNGDVDSVLAVALMLEELISHHHSQTGTFIVVDREK